jgi:hypothetical protein
MTDPVEPQKYSRMTDSGRAVWMTERLWELARSLPVRQVPISEIQILDMNLWFGPDDVPTCGAVAAHAQRIYEADLRYPIILSAEGGLMDGGHRICKAWILGHTEIAAVQFAPDPEPDYILPDAV